MDSTVVAYQQQPGSLELTSDIFGKMLLLVWSQRHGKSVLPSREDLVKCLLEADAPPATVANVMHVDSRGGVKRIQEFTYYIAAAQEAGFLRRMNPSYVVGEATIDKMSADRMLDRYASIFPTEVSWLQKRLASLQ